MIVPPYGYGFGEPRPPEDENQDLASAYANMIRGGAPDRQMGLMGRLPRPTAAAPVPRGTSEAPSPYAEPIGTRLPPTNGAEEPPQYYIVEPGDNDQWPPQPAQRVPEAGGGGQEGRYRQMVDEYMQSLTQPVRLPEPTPYSKREKLGMLAAREPWQREVIVNQHREPYERAMAEAQINERRRSGAAGMASDMEKAQQYERLTTARANQPSQELDYTDKVEKAQADAGNADYPYTKPQWRALAQFKARESGAKTAGTREEALKQLDDQIRKEEDQVLQARSDVMGMDLGMELSGDRQNIIKDAGGRKAKIVARRNAIAGMTEDIYRKFWNLTAQQQDEVIAAFEKKMSAPQNPTGQPGPVAPGQSYYP